MKKKLLVVLLLGVILISLTGCLSMISPELNKPPVLAPISDATVTAGETFTYTVDATDPDGDDLTYSLTTNPASNMTIDQNTGVINWTPTAVGSYEVTVEVFDGELTDTQNFTVTVSTDNQAPLIISVPVTSVTLGEIYIYPVEATDPEGNTLTFSLTTNPSTDMVINEDSGVITWTPAAAGNYEVTVEVSDGSESTTQSFAITVDKALLTSIVVLPHSMTLEIGESEAITSVIAHYDNGTEANITPLTACTYVSNKPSVATVSSDGVVTGVSSCTASTPVTITVTYIEDSITQTDIVSVVVTNPSPG
jgi:hypothetical protein